MELSPKQIDYWNNATHRWNIKEGATRSGKTWLDYYLIPKRIRAIQDKPGTVILLGNTQATLERNILEPMRNLYGDALVSRIRNENKVVLFGRTAYALGADKITQVDRIRGAGIAYCYGDEVATWNKEVFEMLKSRLDKEYSLFDGTCNPEGRNHWFLKFLESGADIFRQSYQLDDNPFIPRSFVENLKEEYRGTVYYNRYILGEWCNAEGLLFPQFADNPEKWEVEELPFFMQVNIGLDIGGTRSHSTLVATGIERNYSGICSFLERKIEHAKGTIDAERLCEETVAMLDALYKEGFVVSYVFVDNAEQVLLNSIRAAVYKAGFSTQVTDCKKVQGKTRILIYNQLMNQQRMKFRAVPMVVESLSTALYDTKKSEDTILDDFTTDIDTFDAHFYSWSKFMSYITGGIR
ncbi:MAG: terminase family protein [Erysipelotrichaceae bacterium]|nr:terminase family protein [Erysipelotrichaceae bacterium]